MKELKYSKSTKSLLTLVVFAGSENDNRTGVSGQGRPEGSHINTLILALRNVFFGLLHDDDHVLWADSKLSTVLKDAVQSKAGSCADISSDL